MALEHADEMHLLRAIELARLSRAKGNYWSGIGRVVYALGSEALMAIVNDVSGSGTLALSCREVLARGGRTVEVSGPHLEEQARPAHEGFWN